MRIILAFLFFSATFYLQGQSYIQTDTGRVEVIIYDAGLRTNCSGPQYRTQKGDWTVLKPKDAEAYFIAPSKWFYSLEVVLEDTTRQVFVKEMETEGPEMYQYAGPEGSFFFITDPGTGELVMLSRDNFREELGKYYEEDPKILEMLSKSNFRYVPKLIERIERGDLSRLPETYIALEAGLLRTNFSGTGNSVLMEQNIPAGSNFTFGIRMVVPIKFSPVSFNSGLNLSHYVVRGGQEENGLIDNFELRSWQVQIPLMLRYSLTEGKFRPYFATGLRLSSLASPTHESYTRISTDSVLTEDLFDKDLFSRNLIHWGICLGSEIQLSTGKILYLETRYFYHLRKEDTYLRRNDFEVVMGFSL